MGDQEYYVYNGFDAVLSALQMTALVFSDNAYNALFFSVITMGIVFGGAALYAKLMTGGNATFAGWAVPVAAGVILYLGFVVPKSSIVLYDPVMNKTQTVGGIPDGIVTIMGLLNQVERAIVDVIDTAGAIGAPKYTDGAGGIGFSLMKAVHSTTLSVGDTYLDKSLAKYIDDCVIWELTRPGTSLSANDIRSTSTNFMTEFAYAANPGAYTVYYTEADHNGDTMTCFDAWQNIQAWLLDPARMENAEKAVCGSAGIDPSDPLQFQSCKEIIQDYDGYTGNVTSIPSANYLRQVYMAKVLDKVILSDNPDLAVRTMASRSYMNSGISAGIVANEFVPTLRAVILGLTIFLTPFLLLFLPTPLVGKVIGILFGFFVFNTAFGIADAITFTLAQDYAYDRFEEVRQHSRGFVAMMATPEAADKSLAMFGYIRSMGIMIATILTNALVGFGGHAMAMMAGNLSGNIQQAAASAPGAADPEKLSQAVKGARQVHPIMTWANHHSSTETGQADAHDMLSRTKASLKTIDEVGGGSVDASSDRIARDSMMKAVKSTATTETMSPDQMATVGSADGGRQMGMAQGFVNAGMTAGMSGSPQEIAERSAHDLSQYKTEKELGSAQGELGMYGEVLGLKDGYEVGQFKAEGSKVSREMAEHAHANGYKSIQEGMTLKALSRDAEGGVMATGAVTTTADNIDAIKASLSPGEAAMVREKMLMSGTFDAKSGIGTYGAGSHVKADNVSTGKEAAENLQLRTQAGRYSFQNAVIEQSGGLTTVTGVDADGNRITLHGSSDSAKYGGTGKLESMDITAATIKSETGVDAMEYAGKDRLHQMADQAEARGALNQAQGYRTLANTLQDGETSLVQTKRDLDGNLATISTRHGGEMSSYDVSKQEFTSSHKEGHTDSYGYEINGNSMLNAAISKDKGVLTGNRVASASTNAQREQVIVDQEIAFAEKLSSMVNQRGVSLGYSEGSVSAGAKTSAGFSIFGTGARIEGGTSGNIGTRSTEEHNYNLYLGKVKEIDATAMSNATAQDGTVNWNTYHKQRSEGYNTLYNQTRELLDEAKGENFGADAPANEIYNKGVKPKGPSKSM